MKVTTEVEIKEITDIVMRLGILKFFPQNEQALVAAVGLVAEMVSSMDHARWLVSKMLESFDEWPGPVTLRETYCARYPDQTEAAEDPPHPFWIEHATDPPRQLPPSAPPDPDRIRTSGPWPEDLLLKPRLPARKTLPEQPILVPGKDFKPITADDIEKVRQTLRGEPK